jgi:phosphatidylinositol alpha-1,6-mannosyltransferase
VKLSEFNVMMLLTDAFGGFGGISRFNRDFLTALDTCGAITRTLAFPRVIRDTIAEELPESVVYFRTSAAGKSRYFRQVMRGLYLSPEVGLVICGHIHLLPLAYIVAKAKRARLALIIHGFEAWQPTRYPLANTLASRVDAVIAVSRLSAQRFVSWSSVALERVFVLGNCVDLDHFVPMPRDEKLAARYGLTGRRVIMTLGRLANRERYKGFDEVLDVLPLLIQKIPDIRYLIVGDGDDRSRLEDKVSRLGLTGHVVFAGKTSESEKVAHYSLADAYVMPSSGEGFGIVLLEAAACGVPVIGSMADGSREALLNGALGRLVDPKNPKVLAETILRTLESPGLRQRPEAVAVFGVTEFQAKVCHWTERQLEAIRSDAMAA